LSPDEEAARSNIGILDTDAYHAVSQFKWSDNSTRVLFVVLHGEHELTLVSATSDRRVAVADLSPKCAPHCIFVRADNIYFLEHGVAFDLKGTDDFVGTNQHLIVRNEEFSPLLRR
jgi:hypothetical protein